MSAAAAGATAPPGPPTAWFERKVSFCEQDRSACRINSTAGRRTAHAARTALAGRDGWGRLGALAPTRAALSPRASAGGIAADDVVEQGKRTAGQVNAAALGVLAHCRPRLPLAPTAPAAPAAPAAPCAWLFCTTSFVSVTAASSISRPPPNASLPPRTPPFCSVASLDGQVLQGDIQRCPSGTHDLEDPIMPVEDRSDDRAGLLPVR